MYIYIYVGIKTKVYIRQCILHTQTHVGAQHWAAANGTAAACDLLLKAGAKLNVRNKDGMTPLELATHFNNAQTIHVLRSYGVCALPIFECHFSLSPSLSF